jgi:hypothetical protein
MTASNDGIDCDVASERISGEPPCRALRPERAYRPILMDDATVTRVRPIAPFHHISRRLGVNDLGAIDRRQPHDARQIDGET